MSVQQWSAEETNALLAIWSTRDIQDKIEGSVRKKCVYEEIAGEMATATELLILTSLTPFWDIGQQISQPAH